MKPAPSTALFPLLLAGLSLVLLAAHFYREALWPLAAGCLLSIGLLAWRRRVGLRLLQAVLVLGCAEWLWTAWTIAQERLALGRPWTRMALILVAVALLTALAAALLGRVLARDPGAQR